MSIQKNLVLGVLIAVTTLGRAEAPLPYSASPMELIALPEYCQVRLAPEGRYSSHVVSMWTARVGGRDVWLHIHHYCHGIKFMNRAQSTMTRQHKQYYLQQAVREFDYVLSRWSKDTQLWADAAMRKQMAEMFLKFA